MGRKKKEDVSDLEMVEMESENLEQIETYVEEQTNETVMEEPVSEVIEERMETVEQSSGPITVNIKLDKHSVYVDYVIAATNQSEKVIAANKEIRLMHGRFYMVPVYCDPSVDSDNFGYMKVFSDVADIIDVRYVKNGVACIMPLAHNIVLKDGQRLCALW